jgi:proline iminopeptidase
LVEDIEALRIALGVSRIALLAHSFAGALALEYAAQYPEHVSRIVMLDAISDLPTTARSVCERLAEAHPDAYARSGPDGGAPSDAGACNVTRALTGQALTRFFRDNAFPNPVVEKRVDSVYKASGLQNTGELSRALFNGPSSITGWRFTSYDRLTMPVLVLAGRQDYQVGVTAPRELATKLPHARFILYEHSGHYPNLDEPERFAPDVISFLSADARQVSAP